jgi:hypothetical protein
MCDVLGAAKDPDEKQSGQNREIDQHMRREAPTFAGMTEAAAGDIESARLRRYTN